MRARLGLGCVAATECSVVAGVLLKPAEDTSCLGLRQVQFGHASSMRPHRIDAIDPRRIPVITHEKLGDTGFNSGN